MKKRWYDKHSNVSEAFRVLRGLDDNMQSKIAYQIMEISKSLKLIYKEYPQSHLSLGIERVLGLYKYENKRRWYDREVNSSLSFALKTISTLPEDDFKAIMESVKECL